MFNNKKKGGDTHMLGLWGVMPLLTILL